PVLAGNQLTYTLTVHNGGPSDAQAVSVSDTLPGALTGASYTVGGGPSSSWSGSAGLGTVAAGVTKTVVITGTVNPSTADATVLHNTASVSSSTSDTAPGNNSASAQTTVNTQADLSITKVDSPDPVLAGNQLTYTLTVHNGGPSDAQAVSVTDALPAGLTGATYTVDGGVSNPWSGSASVGVVGAGGTKTVVVTATVDPSTANNAVLHNTASVSSSTSDTTPGNNSASADTTVKTQAHLSIAKADSPDPVIAGNQLTYTLTVQNAGPSDAQAVSVTDTLPTGLTGATAVVDGGSSSSWSGSTSLGVVAAGSTHTVVITATVDPSTPDATVLHNTASVSSSTSDPTPGNNSASEDTTVNTQADLSISKLDSPDPVLAGNLLTYTLTVHNGGPSDAQAVSVSDVLPAGLSGASYSVNGGLSSSWLGSAGLGGLGPGGDDTVVITATVDSSTANNTVLHNTASVSSSTADPVSANNSASAQTTVNTQADLSITKVDSPDPVLAGNQLTYTLTVHNGGPSDAQAVSVTDALPAGLTGATYTVDGGVSNPWSGSASVGVVGAGGTKTVVVTATVDPSTANNAVLHNTASVSSSTSDTTPGNNSASADTTVKTQADLSIAKADSPDPVIAGNQLTYTLTVQNAGPSDAQAVSVSDTLPTGLTGATAVVDGGSRSSWSGSTSLGVVAAGSTHTVVMTATVDPSTPDATVLHNTASVSSSTSDPTPGNNSASEDTTVKAEADLSVVKSGPASVFAGESISYSLTVHNGGPSDAQAVTVSDSLPAG